jgi:hypothetical protein
MLYLRLLDLYTLKRVHISELDVSHSPFFMRSWEALKLREDEAVENEEFEIIK